MTLFDWQREDERRRLIRTAKFGAKGARKPAEKRLQRITTEKLKREQGKAA